MNTVDSAYTVGLGCVESLNECSGDAGTRKRLSVDLKGSMNMTATAAKAIGARVSDPALSGIKRNKDETEAVMVWKEKR